MPTLSSSLGAQRAARARAEVRVVEWEGKVEELRAGGEGEREGWAAANLERAGKRCGTRRTTCSSLEVSAAVGGLGGWGG